MKVLFSLRVTWNYLMCYVKYGALELFQNIDSIFQLRTAVVKKQPADGTLDR